MTELTSKVFLGRQVIVDWSVKPEIYRELKDGIVKLPVPDFTRLTQNIDPNRERVGLTDSTFSH